MLSPEITLFKDAQLNDPIILTTLGGHIDGSGACWHTLDFITNQFQLLDLAFVDPEPFYKFSFLRPIKQVDSDGNRKICWPEITFQKFYNDANDRDIVLLDWFEPNINWKTAIKNFMDYANHIGAKEIITFSSSTGETPHSRPTPIYLSYPEHNPPKNADKFHYIGNENLPGFLSVFTETLTIEGFDVRSVHAVTPYYIEEPPIPTAVKAISDAISAISDIKIDPMPNIEVNTWLAEIDDHIVIPETDITNELERLEKKHDEIILNEELTIELDTAYEKIKNEKLAGED